MTFHFDLNFFGWLLVAFGILNIIVEPFVFGKDRKPYSPYSWIASLISFVIVLLALGVIR